MFAERLVGFENTDYCIGTGGSNPNWVCKEMAELDVRIITVTTIPTFVDASEGEGSTMIIGLSRLRPIQCCWFVAELSQGPIAKWPYWIAENEHADVLVVVGCPMNFSFLAIYAFSNSMIMLRQFLSQLGFHFRSQWLVN